MATGTDFILREYLDGAGVARLMVVGERVVGSLVYDNLPNDFRTNAAPELHPRLIQYPPELEALAVASVWSVGAEMGGVDVLLDKQGQPYLLEMNMPCGFATFPRLGIDVPGMLVDYLIVKAARLCP